MADSTNQLPPDAPPSELELIVAGEHSDPHRVLGLHDGMVRAYRPGSVAMRVVPRGAAGPIEMTRAQPAGIFEALVPSGTDHYQLEADYGGGGSISTFTFQDPYRAWPTFGPAGPAPSG